MTIWEYDEYRCKTPVDVKTHSIMHQRGDLGYECYAVTNDEDNTRTYYFKRPIEKKPSK